MGESFELGPFFKKYRKQRHISLRAASPAAPSTLSRFENGQTRMAGERLRAVMLREGLRYWDMQQHSVQYLSPFKQLADLLYLERFNMQSERVEQTVDQYEQRTANASGRLNALNRAVIAAIMKSRASSEPVMLVDEFQNDIQSLLFGSRDWIIYDYSLLRLAAMHLKSPVLKRCFKRALIQKQTAPAAYNDYFLRLLEQVCLVLLRRHDEDVQKLCAPYLDAELVNRFDGEDAFTVQYLNIMLRGKGRRAETDGVALAELLSMLDTLALTDMRAYFYENAERILG